MLTRDDQTVENGLALFIVGAAIPFTLAGYEHVSAVMRPGVETSRHFTKSEKNHRDRVTLTIGWLYRFESD